jgi:hypothetical protein
MRCDELRADILAAFPPLLEGGVRWAGSMTNKQFAITLNHTILLGAG